MTGLAVAAWAAFGACLLLLATVIVVLVRLARLDRRAARQRTEVSAVLRSLLVGDAASAPAPRRPSTLHAVAAVASRVSGEDRDAIQTWLRDHGALPLALAGMRSRRPLTRARALRLYVRAVDRPSSIIMQRMLEDRDSRVRGICALEWGSTGREEAVAPMLAAVCRRENRLPPLVASIAIMRCRLLDISSLDAAWSTGDPDGLRVALATGSAAGLPGVQPHALAALDDDDVLVRIAAADALRRVGTRPSLHALGDRARVEENPVARRHLISAIGALGGA